MSFKLDSIVEKNVSFQTCVQEWKFVYWRFDTEQPVSGFIFDITADRDSADVLSQLASVALEEVQHCFYFYTHSFRIDSRYSDVATILMCEFGL